MSPDESQDPARPGEWTSPVPQDAAPGIPGITQPHAQPYGGYPVAPPRRANTGLILGLSIGFAFLAAIGVGAYALVASSGSPTSTAAAASDSATADAINSAVVSAIQAQASSDDSTSASPTSAAVALPASVDGLQLLKSSSAQAEASRVRTGVSKGGATYTGALIGAYGPQANGGWRLVLVDQPFTNLTAATENEFTSTPAATIVDEITTAVKMAGTQVETSSDSSAAISCGTLAADGQTIPTCIWVDSTSFGLAYFYPTYYTTSLDSAAHYTDDLRAAAEAG
ncbi:hypothetical protein KDK95_01300 [Actinospica sp. MGRD01-02]|uniref:Uncharacterized protein n=1 Tax=Actinospica acidithermotolerans TaxID=2828514 RepID=A0A941E5R4_9ACTN|nr:hypothetical protein [Actinospica acidithermotolerans]MBR7824927.1 hypothetical protein [Actinospica acidithermotolerans]